MIRFILFLVVLATSSFAQSTCPNTILGECKPISECPSLLKIWRKPFITPSELKLLRDARCQPTDPAGDSSSNQDEMVCCPSQNPEITCFTPEGNLGRCVNISSCEQLSGMLQKFPVPQETVNYLKSTKCHGMSRYSVCCSLKPVVDVIMTTTISTTTTIKVIPKSKNGVILGGACTTPDGNPGTCVNISSCDHLARMIAGPPLSQENITYLKKSRCRSLHRFSVCCGPNPTEPISSSNDATLTVSAAETSTLSSSLRAQGAALPGSTSQPKDCKETNSAYPPDPSSLCCGRDSNMKNKIIGGEQVDIDEYPWLILITYSDLVKRTCGGSLISVKYVLTASHCVFGPQLRGATPTHVIIGEYDRSSDGPDCSVNSIGEDCTDGEKKIEIEKLILHPDGLDIALIRLKEFAPYTYFIRPICLPTTDVTSSPPESLKLQTAGWGATENMSSSNVKMAVELPFVNESQCQSFLGSKWNKVCAGSENTPYCQTMHKIIFQPHMVCAGGVKGKDTCSGDSGGPLMYENGKTFEIIGVLSVGPTPCAQKDHPAMYVKVIDNIDWIKRNIEP